MAAIRCVDNNCALSLHGRVRYCPSCGRSQLSATQPSKGLPQESDQSIVNIPKALESKNLEIRPRGPASVEGLPHGTPTPTPAPSAPPIVVARPEILRRPLQTENDDSNRVSHSQVEKPSRNIGKSVILSVGIALVLVAGFMHFRNERTLQSPPQAVVAKPTATKPATVSPQKKIQLDVAMAETAIKGMLSAQAAKNEGEFIQNKKTLDALSKPKHQNRAAAREFNTEGLRLLSQKEFSLAVRQFQLGTEADPADVELQANLGYAQLKGRNSADAVRTLFGALAFSSERVSSWTALGQSLAALGDEGNAVAAFQIGYRFSGNKEKVSKQFRALRDEQSDQKIVAALTRFLQGLDEGVAASSGIGIQNTANNNSKPALVSTPPTTDPERAISQPSASTPNAKHYSNSIVTDMLDDADACMAIKKFDCAMTSAQSALRVDPGNARAQSMRQRAEAEQKRALQSISIN